MKWFDGIAESMLGLGAFLSATVFSPAAIPEKSVGDAFSAEEFNVFVNSVDLFHRDDRDTPADYSDDYLGVGVTTPAYRLEVDGDIKTSGDLRADGDLYVAKVYGDGSGLTNVASNTWIESGDDINYPDGNVAVGAGATDYQFDVRYTGSEVFHIGDDIGDDFTIDVGTSEGLVNLVAGAKYDGSDYVYTGTRGAARLQLHDGAARFTTGDLTTGVDGQAIAWNTGLNLDNNGFVGVRVADPAYPLDVSGQLRVGVANDSFMSALLTSEDDQNFVQLQTTHPAPTAAGTRILSGSTVVGVQRYDIANDQWDFYAGSDLPSNLVMSMKSNGRVGIGEQNPTQALHVDGNIAWGSNAMLKDDQGGSIELGDAASNPYIDFKNDPTSDFDVRLSLIGNDTLEIAGGTLVAPEPTLPTEVANKNYVDDRSAFAQLTNTLVSEVNDSSGAVITFDTTALHNSDSTLFTPVNTGLQVLESGVYEVQTNIYLTGTVQRANVGVEFTVNGTKQTIRGAGGYIRNEDGHTESSVHMSQILTLSANDIVGVNTTQLAASGTVTAPSGRSNLIIKRLQ